MLKCNACGEPSHEDFCTLCSGQRGDIPGDPIPCVGDLWIDTTAKNKKVRILQGYKNGLAQGVDEVGKIFGLRRGSVHKGFWKPFNETSGSEISCSS